jgi:hypothetical protein
MPNDSHSDAVNHDRPAIGAASSLGHYRLATLGARNSAIRQGKRDSGGAESLLAPKQATTTNVVPHSEPVHTGPGTDTHDSQQDQKRVHLTSP